MVVMTALVCLAFLVWLVAVSTDYWVVVIGDGVAGTPGILIKEIPSGHPIVSAANTQTGMPNHSATRQRSIVGNFVGVWGQSSNHKTLLSFSQFWLGFTNLLL